MRAEPPSSNVKNELDNTEEIISASDCISSKTNLNSQHM